MKRDWDVIRDILIEVEALDCAKFEHIQYGPASESEEPQKAKHGVLLRKAGFIDGTYDDGQPGEMVLATGLTWTGHDLLQTIRSKTVWERIKTIAKDKGLELTFDGVKELSKLALVAVVKS
jgi:hypothetical protein